MDAQRFELYSGGAYPLNTVITDNNNQQVITKKTVNVMLKLLFPNKQPTNDEQRSVVDFLRAVSVKNYNGHNYKTVLDLLVRDYKQYLKSGTIKYDTYDAYKQKEVHYLTPDESGLKFSVYPHMHDTYRGIEEKTERKKELAAREVSQADVNRSMVKMANTVVDVCSPQAMSTLYEKMRSFNITYQSTTIPRQTLCFDSRNRNPVTSDLTTISWNFNYTKSKTAGPGNVTVQRPIQHIIRVNIDNPFWLWVVQQNMYIASDNDNAGIIAKNQSDFFRLTMNIVEFNAQNVTVELPRGYDNLQYLYYTFALTLLGAPKTDVATRVLVTPSSPFTFMKPLAQLDNITLRFFNDYNPIYIFPDFYQFSTIKKETTVVDGVSSSKLIISGMVGKTAEIYSHILSSMIKNFQGTISYPIDIVTTLNINEQFYATPVHISHVDTSACVFVSPTSLSTLDLDKLICTSSGWLGQLDFNYNPNVLTKQPMGFSANDEITINVTNTAIASYPDFEGTRTDPPLISLYLDAMSFTINLEFISLEMPAY